MEANGLSLPGEGVFLHRHRPACKANTILKPLFANQGASKEAVTHFPFRL